MKLVKKSLPILLALFVVSVGSYYTFYKYKPDILSQVKGAKSSKSQKSYIDSIPLPTGSRELGRNVREDFSQITALCTKSPKEAQKFFRSVLVSKGWKVKTQGEDLLSTIYTRDGERFEVSVLSFDNEGTVFSLSYTQ